MTNPRSLDYRREEALRSASTMGRSPTPADLRPLAFRDLERELPTSAATVDARYLLALFCLTCTVLFVASDYRKCHVESLSVKALVWYFLHCRVCRCGVLCRALQATVFTPQVCRRL